MREVRKEIANTGRDVVLYPQPENYGCIYYSFASLVNDDWWINRRYTNECSYRRFISRAFKNGFQLYPWYKNFSSKSDPETITSELPYYGYMLDEGEHLSLHLVIDSLKYKNTTHCVGLQVINIEDDDDGYATFVFAVLDPGKDKPILFTEEEFKESPYSKCWEIWEVFEGSHTEFDSCWGPSQRIIPLEEDN